MTKIDDTYYICTPVMSKEFDGPSTLLGKTRDFIKYEEMGLITLPKNRGASLFPEKINGKYYKLDRPGGGKGALGTIWTSSSPDLLHWGDFKPLLSPYCAWNWTKIGPTPPIKTDKGWLVIIHGVNTPCDGSHYYIGAMLLKLDDPTIIIGKTYSYLLAPKMDYETNGQTDNVVFPCGAIAEHEKDNLRLYYGATDSTICLAEGSLSMIIEACEKNI
jgi:predicted GH43/DUF377 family glycosyl hydrolase